MEKQKQQQQIISEKQTCQLFLAKKNRLCKFPCAEGSKYCPAHCRDLQDKKQCPYEKGMFISIKKYDKHLKNCPMIKNRAKEESSGWYFKGINKEGQVEQKQQIEDNQNGYNQSKVKICLSSVSEQQQKKVIIKIIKIYSKYLQPSERIHFVQSTPCEKSEDKTNDLLQSQLIVQKANENKLISTDYVYVEFGAGKGILSFAIGHYIKQQFKKFSKNILLERESRRLKFDKYFRDNPFFQRYKGDVSNFDFSKLVQVMTQRAKQKIQGMQIKPKKLSQETIQLEIAKCELIGVCKHMCGQALDISMRGLLKGNTKGCILASCCHHRCSYETYLNNGFFTNEGFSKEDVELLFKLSSWGTKSDVIQSQYLESTLAIWDKWISETDSNLQRQIGSDQKVIIGRICKRLIDFGRAQFLKGKLYRYCSDQLTPENYVIIAKI